MVKLFDRVKVNIATTGVGDVTFGAAASDAFLTPTEAGCIDGDVVRYVIVDGTDYEEGTGTIADTVSTMTRTVTKSKIGGSSGTTKINLSGAAVLALVAGAADILTPSGNLSGIADTAAAQGNLGASTVGKALFTAASVAAAHAAIRQSVRVITGTDTIVASDIGKTLIFSSTSAFTLAVTAAATLGNGFWCRFKNIEVGLVTIDPNGSETIDGQSTAIVPKFDTGMLVCDGTAFHTLEHPPVVLLGSGSFSSSATLNLALPPGFAELEINLSDLKPSAASAVLGRVSDNSGSSYATGYYTSWWRNTVQTPAMSPNGLTAQSYMRTPATIPTGNSGGSVKMIFPNITNNASYFRMNGVVQSLDSSSENQMVHFQNWLNTYAAYNFLQLFPETGNWASGSWQMYGKRKAA